MYIVADIGGTKTRIAGSRDLSKPGEPVIIDTPAHYEAGLRSFVADALRIAAGESIQTVAIGIAGLLSRDKRQIALSPHLSQWCGKPFAQDLEQQLKTKVVLENDTALVGLGEATQGAGKRASILAYITVSTGVNGVRVVDDKIDRSYQGFEIGGQYLLVGEQLETLEDLISGSAMQKRLGKHPREVPKDSPEWEELAMLTAVGVHNAIMHWSPERVVLGGSMFNEIGISVQSVQQHVKTLMKKFDSAPEIVHASLDEVGGLWGGLTLLKQITHSGQV